MTGRSNAVGGGSNKYKFTFKYSTVSGNETLNDDPISPGDAVFLEAGSFNVLYAPLEAARLYSEDGQTIPFSFSASRNNPSTKATPPSLYYIQFVMPSQNCYYDVN